MQIKNGEMKWKDRLELENASYSLNKIMAKLKEISEFLISMAFQLMNAEKILRLLRLFLSPLWDGSCCCVAFWGFTRGLSMQVGPVIP